MNNLFGDLPLIQIFVHGVTILGLMIIISQLRDSRIESKRQRSYRISDRYWDTYSNTIYKARQFLDDHTISQPDKWEMM